MLIDNCFAYGILINEFSIWKREGCKVLKKWNTFFDIEISEKKACYSDQEILNG